MINEISPYIKLYTCMKYIVISVMNKSYKNNNIFYFIYLKLNFNILKLNNLIV